MENEIAIVNLRTFFLEKARPHAEIADLVMKKRESLNVFKWQTNEIVYLYMEEADGMRICARREIIQ